MLISFLLMLILPINRLEIYYRNYMINYRKNMMRNI